MEWMKSIQTPETLIGTAGAYGLHAKSESGEKLYINLGLAPTVGRKDGQNYNAIGLMVRLLITGKEPKTPEGFEVRETKAYKLNSPDGEEVWAQQMNKMLWPVATANVGTEVLQQLLTMHFEALSELLSPLMTENGLTPLFSLASIFEAQNPAVYLPVITFDGPKSIKSWQETVDAIKADVKKGYQPKHPGYKEGDGNE